MSHAISLMRHLVGDDADIGRAPPKIEAWIDSLAMPIDLKRMLQWTWPSTPILIGNVEFTDPVGMFHFDHRDKMIEESLFPIGQGINGDPFLIDFSTPAGPVGFLCLQATTKQRIWSSFCAKKANTTRFRHFTDYVRKKARLKGTEGRETGNETRRRGERREGDKVCWK